MVQFPPRRAAIAVVDEKRGRGTNRAAACGQGLLKVSAPSVQPGVAVRSRTASLRVCGGRLGREALEGRMVGAHQVV